ncbi:MAG: aldehyde dehydrogenase family protein [Pseudobdellovibrio sp.]
MSLKQINFAGDFISGKFVKNEKADGQFKDVSPADLNDQIFSVTYQLDHVEKACRAAKDAYLGWAKLSLNDRKNYLLKLKDIFVEHESEMAELIARAVSYTHRS